MVQFFLCSMVSNLENCMRRFLRGFSSWSRRSLGGNVFGLLVQTQDHTSKRKYFFSDFFLAFFQKGFICLTINILSPSKQPPSDIIHLCQRFFQTSKHFWNEPFGIACFDLSFNSSIVAKCFPFIRTTWPNQCSSCILIRCTTSMSLRSQYSSLSQEGEIITNSHWSEDLL